MRRLTRRGVVLAALACAGLVSCDGHTLKGGYFSKDSLRYKVAEPDSAQSFGPNI